jgi:hypothetical protein
MDLFKLNQFAVQDANWVLKTVATFAAPSRQQHCMFFQSVCHTSTSQSTKPVTERSVYECQHF